MVVDKCSVEAEGHVRKGDASLVVVLTPASYFNEAAH